VVANNNDERPCHFLRFSRNSIPPLTGLLHGNIGSFYMLPHGTNRLTSFTFSSPTVIRQNGQDSQFGEMKKYKYTLERIPFGSPGNNIGKEKKN
jgi:hypothetical protein